MKLREQQHLTNYQPKTEQGFRWDMICVPADLGYNLQSLLSRVQKGYNS